MGTSVHVVVHGDPDLADQAKREIERLEQLWSRFLPDSEISQLNDAAGGWVSVSPETVELVERAVLAHAVTGGRYDPTVLAALQANGYDRTFDAIEPFVSVTAGGGGAPGCGGIILDPGRRAIVLPRGVGIDPGGIGK